MTRTTLELTVFVVGEKALNEGSKLVARKCCEAHQAGVQTLQLRLAHRVEINAGRFVNGPRPLKPPQQDLGSARVCDRGFSQPTLDIAVGRRRTVTTVFTARRLKGVERVFCVGCA
jgi:hypothetical protein